MGFVVKVASTFTSQLKRKLFSYGIEDSKNLRFESLIIVDPNNYMHCIRISSLAELIL